MYKIALISLLMLTACDNTWVYAKLPAPVQVPTSLSQENVDAVGEAMAYWLAVNPRLFTKLVATDTPTCGIILEPGEPSEPSYLAETRDEVDCKTMIVVRPYVFESPENLAYLLKHELGHVILGPAHSEDSGNTMNPHGSHGQLLLNASQVEAVKHRVEEQK